MFGRREFEIGAAKNTAQNQSWLDACNAVISWYETGDEIIFQYDPGIEVSKIPAGINFQGENEGAP